MTRNSDIPNLLLVSFKADPDAVRSRAQMSKTSLFYCQYTCSVMTYPVNKENERPKSCQL